MSQLESTDETLLDVDESPAVSAKRRELQRVNGMREASSSLLANLRAADSALAKLVPAAENAALVIERWSNLMDTSGSGDLTDPVSAPVERGPLESDIRN
jgi:hypothetical protein